MHFKIVSTGWKNWPWVKQTLESIDAQEYKDYEVCVVDDASEDPRLTEFIPEYCEQRGWRYVLNDERKGALYNQVESIKLMEPDPEDVIIFLDPDGDRFAHPRVLDRLIKAYSDGSLLVYSMYSCDPPSPTSQQSRPHPQWVIDSNGYRKFSLKHGIWWNHLRTLKASLFLQLETSDFLDDQGRFFDAGTDSAIMFPCLELAKGKVKFFEEVLMIYRPDHEHSDWKRQPKNVDRIHEIILTRPPKC